MKKHFPKNGFTLIELIIVITVVTVLISLVVSLNKFYIHSKYQMVAKEYSNIKNSVDNFKTIFDQLPGDFNRASFHFDNVLCPNGNAPTGCNGNNNNIIDTYDESYRFWQHLYLSGLINKSFTGVKSINSPFSTDANSYSSKFINNALFFVGSINASMKFEPSYGNRIYLDKVVASYFSSTSGVLSPQKALAFDNKFDDGKPRTGIINSETFYDQVNVQNSPYCTELGPLGSESFNTLINDNYNSAIEQTVCRLIFRF
ncbi:MAG: type II secretion system protein [Rickettsiales bacterium]|nr:type II secretion system protein [Rickettsiales bacterium]